MKTIQTEEEDSGRKKKKKSARLEGGFPERGRD